jgi:hypothetical protein
LGLADPEVVLNPLVILKPLAADDLDFVWALEHEPDALQRYRHRGVVRSPADFVASLWADVLFQFIVVSVETNERLGVVCCHSPEFRDRRASIAMIARPSADLNPLFMLGVRQFLDYTFSTFDLRKLVGSMIEPNFRAMESGVGRLLQVEGVAREHTFYGGTYVDEYLVAVFRSDWEQRTRMPAGEDFVHMVETLLGRTLIPVELHSPLGGLQGVDSLVVAELVELIEGTGTHVPSAFLEANPTLADLAHVYHSGTGSPIHPGSV